MDRLRIALRVVVGCAAVVMLVLAARPVTALDYAANVTVTATPDMGVGTSNNGTWVPAYSGVPQSRTMEEVTQGFVHLVPWVFFSGLAFWLIKPPLFMLLAAVSIMTGLKIPDLLTGTSTNLSISVGLMLIAYAVACVAFAYLTTFRLGRSYGTAQ
jgi:hypothetical protein